MGHISHPSSFYAHGVQVGKKESNIILLRFGRLQAYIQQRNACLRSDLRTKQRNLSKLGPKLPNKPGSY